MTRKIVVGFILMLTLSASRPAEAARIDVMDRQTAAGAGASLFAGPLASTFSGVFFDTDVASEVWSNPAGTLFTYFYNLSNVQTSGLVPLDPVRSFDMIGSWIAGGSALLDWGNVSGESSGASLEFGNADVEFGLATMRAEFSESPNTQFGGLRQLPGDFLTFYVQATTPPSVFAGSLQGTSVAVGVGYGPSDDGIPPIPEPGSLALIGSGLVGLVVAARRRRQLKG